MMPAEEIFNRRERRGHLFVEKRTEERTRHRGRVRERERERIDTEVFGCACFFLAIPVEFVGGDSFGIECLIDRVFSNGDQSLV